MDNLTWILVYAVLLKSPQGIAERVDIASGWWFGTEVQCKTVGFSWIQPRIKERSAIIRRLKNVKNSKGIVVEPMCKQEPLIVRVGA